MKIRTAIAIAATSAMVLPTGVAWGSNDPAPTPFATNRPCPQEDSVNCFWNASTRGNHFGHSFIVRKLKHQTCWLYADKFAATHWDHCEPNS